MSKILFICAGNVARSQMAEGYYNYFTNSQNASSAGTNKNAPKDYKRLPESVINLMQERNIDISNQKVKLVTEEMVKKAYKIYVMCEEERCPFFLKNSSKVIYWDIEDPHYLPLDDMRRVRDNIERKVRSIIN